MLSHDMTPVDPIAFDSRFSKLPGIRYQLDSASITQPATTSSKVVDHRRKYLISVPEPSIAKPPKGSSMKRDCVLGHGQNLDGSKLDYVEPVPREAREIPSESIHLPVYLGGHNPEPRGIPKPPVVKTFFSDWAEVEKKNNHLKRELADFEIKQKLEIAEHKRHEEELEKINSRSYTWPFEGRFSSPKPPNKAVHRHSTKNAEYAEQLRRQVQERRNAHEASEKEDQRLQQAHIESDYFKPQLVYRRQFRKEVDQRSPDVFIDPISGRVIARETKKADHRHRQVMQAHADSRGESQRARPFRDPFKHASPEIERSKLIYRRLLDEQLAIREKIREEERTQAVQPEATSLDIKESYRPRALEYFADPPELVQADGHPEDSQKATGDPQFTSKRFSVRHDPDLMQARPPIPYLPSKMKFSSSTIRMLQRQGRM